MGGKLSRKRSNNQLLIERVGEKKAVVEMMYCD